jgi:ribosomal protein S18 acetylase RimI-like enzyme
MTEDVEIAPGTQSERSLLYWLAKETFGAVPGWSDDAVVDVLQRDAVFVAHELERPAGYIALRREPASATVVIEHVFVAPGHEGRGIGRLLLAYAEGYAIAQRAAALRVVAEQCNMRARSLYRRLGFVPVGAELLELALPHGG